ncbi:MAG: hypothetical protein JRM82_03110, partial [Nitrososphaerota archaeon]|nr:hypothetical protein [Nitrososphaerota archaeon]
GFGVLDAGFDAFIVIWMRKPISRFARAINPFRLVRAQLNPIVLGDGSSKDAEPALLPLAEIKSAES